MKGGISMQYSFYDIPTVLKQEPNWVTWGILGAPLKSPFNPASLLSSKPSPAKASVRDTWGCYSEAKECVNLRLAQGIGYELTGGIFTGLI